MELGVKDTKHWVFYPEVAEAGGLTAALQNEFIRLQISLTPSPQHTPNAPHLESFVKNLAQVELNRRKCSLHIAARERLFLCSFWDRRVSLADLRSDSLSSVAKAMAAWLVDGLETEEMSKRFAGLFTAKEVSPPYEPENPTEEARVYVEEHWKSLTSRLANETSVLKKLSAIAHAASRRPELRQLMPFTSMLSLHFSRTTGFPFSQDCPHVDPVGEGRYRVYSPKYILVEQEYKESKWMEPIFEVLGEGDAEEAADLLVAGLPPDCGPAIYGTADDLPRPINGSF